MHAHAYVARIPPFYDQVQLDNRTPTNRNYIGIPDSRIHSPPTWAEQADRSVPSLMRLMLTVALEWPPVGFAGARMATLPSFGAFHTH